MKHSYLYLAGLALAMACSPMETAKANTEAPNQEANSVVETPQEVTTETVATSQDQASELPATEPEIETMVEEMSTRQKISQMLMPDFRKWQQEGEGAATDLTVVNEEITEAIDSYDFGGVILFAENVKATEQTLNLTQDMQAAAVTNQANNGKIPLLIAIDQEGGIVYRLGSGTALPGNMALGATRDPEMARQAGEIIGRELSALGINVDFAPVLDTNNNPQNPIIGLRSFSSDPDLVAKLGIPMMEGIQSYNVAVAAKHFPGHGDTAVDSHTGLPLVDKSLEELKQLELAPFKIAMEKGVDMVMTAHIQYPQIEKDTVISKETGEAIHIPATLSDDILTGIVRDQYGYDGIIVSDAMGMDAISKNFGESEAAIMAIQAGVDIVLMPTVLRNKADLAKIDAIIDDIEAAVIRGDISQASLDDSVRRILRLKSKRGILDFSLDDRTAAAANQAVGSELNRDLERIIAASAVTVVKNEDSILPFKVKAGDHVLLLGAYNNELPGLELGMRRLQADGVVPNDITFEAVRYSRDTKLDNLKEKLDGASHILVISEIGRESQLAADFWLTKLPTDVVNYANQTGKLAVVMSISKPYDVANYPTAKAIVAVYGNKGMDPTEALRPDNAFGPNIPAGVEVIFAGLAHKGTLPVDVPEITEGKLSTTALAYSLGHGLAYNEPAKGLALNLPSSGEIGQELPIELLISDLRGLEKSAYLLYLTVNTQHFQFLPSTNYLLEGNQLIINKAAGDLAPVTIFAKAAAAGEHAPILTMEIMDYQARTFSLGQNYYQFVTVNIAQPLPPADVKQEVPKSAHPSQEKHQAHASTAPRQSSAELPKTGESSSWLSLVMGMTGLLAGLGLRKREK